MNTSLSIGPGEKRESTGAQFRGETEIRCGDCGTGLMKCLVTHNNEDLQRLGGAPVTTTIQCKCGSCGGASYLVQIEGCFHPGAWDDDTSFEPVDSENGVVQFRSWRH